ADVAGRAGIARNTIYNYAADKNELMLAFVERSVEDYLEHARGEMGALETASEQMRYLLRSQIEGFLREPGAGSAGGMLEGGSLPPAVFDALMGRLSRVHHMIAEVVERGTRSGEFHRVTDVPATVEMIASVVGSQRMPVGEGTRSVEDAVTHVSSFVMAALMA
ncbi:MAG: TetR/AcrR family transcriptional regulator, partial [Actinomycetota bacterium]